MRLVCPNCASSYAIADDALGEHGRRVRCKLCKHVWHATAASAQPEDALAEAVIADATAASATHVMEAPAAQAAPPGSGLAEADAPIAAETSGEDTLPPHVEAPSITPDEEPAPAISLASGKLDYFELRRQRAMRAIVRRRQGFKATIGHASAAMFGIIVALIFARENIVRLLPQTASLYALAGMHINLRGLVFEDVKTAYDVQDGVRVMTVEGQIRNVTDETRPVGRLRFALLNEAGGSIYTWTAMPDRPVVKPGETQAFKTRLAAPPADGKSLSVRFFQPRDSATEEVVSRGAPEASGPAAEKGR